MNKNLFVTGILLAATVMVFLNGCGQEKSKIHVYCAESNDLYNLLTKMDGITPVRYNTIEELLSGMGEAEPIMILADEYPEKRVHLDAADLEILEQKSSRYYVEFADGLPGLSSDEKNVYSKHERAIVSSSFFSGFPDTLSILSISGMNYIPANNSSSYMVAGTVAGLDSAIFGLPKSTSPLLYKGEETSGLVATTSFSNFIKGRYAPQAEWGSIWKSILQYLVPDLSIEDLTWTPVVEPTYSLQDTLPADYEKMAIKRGADWFRNAKMLIPDGYDEILENAFVPELNTGFLAWDDSIPVGDGSNGIFECIMSSIDENGSQPIGIVRRSDCTGEASGAIAIAGKVLGTPEQYKVAGNLLDYYLKNSIATQKEYGDPNHPAYGLIPWGLDNYAWYKANYGDDNARLFLGAIVTAAVTDRDDWDAILMRMLLAQVRTTGKNGFRGNRIDLPELEAKGWKYFYDRDLTYLSPHMEAYLWACFLWAYDKTQDPVFLDRTEMAIKKTMAEYTDGWMWMNGIAQEKARILLPLAWLVRVRDTEENRKMLLFAVEEFLKLQEECGAIREELGLPETGKYPPPRQNEDYGTAEASLIANNGDPISDLLYTTNFAFLGLHEAWYATGDERIKEAEDKLAKFLCRIQVKSETHPELDGGWMRAFDYERFEHWGSNADVGWGAWAIESGWTQGWITTVLALREMNTSIWDLTKDSHINENYDQLKKEMIP